MFVSYSFDFWLKNILVNNNLSELKSAIQFTKNSPYIKDNQAETTNLVMVYAYTMQTKKLTVMKKYVSLFVLIFLFASFSSPITSTNEEKAIDTINGFYDAMAEFDYVKMSKYCTSDFKVIDDGKYYKNLGEFVELIKTFEGATIKIDMDFMHSEFDSKTGLMLVLFKVDADANGEKMHIEALESYTMKKVKGTWLIHFVHSTPLDK